MTDPTGRSKVNERPHLGMRNQWGLGWESVEYLIEEIYPGRLHHERRIHLEEWTEKPTYFIKYYNTYPFVA